MCRLVIEVDQAGDELRTVVILGIGLGSRGGRLSLLNASSAINLHAWPTTQMWQHS